MTVFVGENPKGHYSLDSLNFMAFYLPSPHQHQTLLSKVHSSISIPFALLLLLRPEQQSCTQCWKRKEKKELKWNQKKRALPEIARPLKSFESVTSGKSSLFHVLKSDPWDEISSWDGSKQHGRTVGREDLYSLFWGPLVITAQDDMMRVPLCAPKTYE